MELIRVYADSPAAAVAGAITGVICEYRRAEVQAVGAQAVNQATQALALATKYMKGDGIRLTCVPRFRRIMVENHQRTAIRFVVSSCAEPGYNGLDLSEGSTHRELPRA